MNEVRMVASAVRRGRTALAAAMMGSTALSLGVAAAPAIAQTPATNEYSIPAGTLASVLNRFADQSGTEIVYDGSLAEGRSSPGLSGGFGVTDALSRILVGSGLTFHRTGSHSFTLERAPRAAPGQSSSGPITTGSLRVEGAQDSTTTAGQDRDARGADDIYDRDTTTTYMGKEEVARYKGVTSSDVLKGMLGVYSGDPRNGGAIDPSIRGISGPGRVPVIIDGTEQALTVWRGYNGASNRAYIDPNLISGMQVQKGPVSERDVDGGIGGAVIVHTLDAGDILRKGQKFGIELKLEGGDNSTSPRWPTLLTGQDYRTVPGFPGSPGTPGSPFLPYGDQTVRVTPRTSDDNHLFSLGYKAIRVAAAARLGNVDLSGAYAYRTQGNYFSGSTGAGYYSQKNLDPSFADTFIQRMGLQYLPGNEVTNTSSETSSWLAKIDWHINGVSDLKAGFRDTLAHYGDILPSRLLGQADMGAIQWPESRVHTQAYNLDYRLQPGLWWLDFKASFWATHTVSATNSRGGFPNAATGPSDPIISDTALLNTRNDRLGVSASNQFKLGSKLDLLVEGNWQREVLRPEGDQATAACSYCLLARSGRREEYRVDFKGEWRPTSFLKFNAGITYSGFSSTDDYLRQLITTGQTQPNHGTVGYTTNIGYNVTDAQSYQYFLIKTFENNGFDPATAEAIAAGAAASYTPAVNGVDRLQNMDSFNAGPNGKFTRAENPCLNGAYNSLPGYVPQSCTITAIQQFFTPTYADTHSGGHNWAPMASATLYLSGTSRIYARYAEAYRYPSIFESTLGFSASFNPLSRLKPEHMHSVEAAFVQDLRPLFHFHGDQKADLKLTWYRNVTTNVIDRNSDLEFYNVDKQKLSGLEIQARYDDGHFFADLGYAHVFTDEACDESLASTLDSTHDALARIPNCVKYGFYGGYLLTQASPDDSFNATLGARFLKRRLELGSRFIWYSAYHNPLLNELTNNGDLSTDIQGFGLNVPYTWGANLTIDAYAKFKVNERLTAELDGTNLTDRYYGDPLTRSLNPAPGRTVRISITARL